MLTWNEIETRAVAFQKRWKNCAGDERQDSQTFEKDFMDVFGVEWREGLHEHQINLRDGSIGYIDYLLPGKILMEIKSRGQSLTRAYSQAMNYVLNLPPEDQPVLLMVSDFDKVEVYNLRKDHSYKPFRITQLKQHVRIFGLLAGFGAEFEERTEIEVNTDASYKMARVHDALKDNNYQGHDLEVYLVRLLFCMFADDAGIFEKGSFLKYIEDSREDGEDLSMRLMMLFSVLDTPPEKRMTNLPEELKRFRYINGEIFKHPLPAASFDHSMRKLLIECARDFDWTQISPSIFGAMFQGVMDKDQRRALGAHYTSEENILKVIRPLFLDELDSEFERSRSTKAELLAFQNKLASYKFLDPACGCGNFLIVAYKELRELEFRVLQLLYDNLQLQFMNILDIIKVRPEQFYGIEIEDFPCQIANVSMILMKHLMDQEVSNYFGVNLIDFPIRDNANIVRANALRLDWNEVVPAAELDYIMGNPPFNGARTMSAEQKSDLLHVFGGLKNVGNLDFVTPWYKKSADIMDSNPAIQTALVSTNSIVQGDQAGILWEYMFERKFQINYAFRTFKWTNAAKGKAAVHCVILGFGKTGFSGKQKRIFDSSGEHLVTQINQYLVEAPKVIIRSRSHPISDVPEIGIGNQPIDGGNFLFTKLEMQDFIAKEPGSEKYFRPWYGAEEFIDRKPRYCLFLGSVLPSEIKQLPLVINRVKEVRDLRLLSPRHSTRKLADFPTKFQTTNVQNSTYLIIPETSSENREYIPIGFLDKNCLASNAVRILPNATQYHFGILTSSTHMAWMRTVAGRLKSDYRYSKDIVYNNFPWPNPTPTQKEKIEQTAQAILDARERYPEASLADLYDELTMPPDLRKAHKANDKAVWEAYGRAWPLDDEPACVAYLMKLYKELT